jgi:hypothetical protein
MLTHDVWTHRTSSDGWETVRQIDAKNQIFNQFNFQFKNQIPNTHNYYYNIETLQS